MLTLLMKKKCQHHMMSILVKRLRVVVVTFILGASWISNFLMRLLVMKELALSLSKKALFMMNSTIFLLQILTGKVSSVLTEAWDISINPLQTCKTRVRVKFGLVLHSNM